MVLWILIVASTIVTIAFVCIPLLRGQIDDADDLETEKVLYAARLEELQKEHALGRIDDASLNAGKAEEARKLLKLSEAKSRKKTLSASLVPAITTAVFISAFSVLVYFYTGSPEVAFQKNIEEALEQSDIDELITMAEKRLETSPDDLRGWMVVAPIYARQEKFEKAINAYENAIRLSENNPELTYSLAELLVNQAKGRVTDEAVTYLEKTTAIQSQHASANFMLGIAASQRGQNDEAKRIWQAMLDNADGSEDWLDAVQKRLDALITREINNDAPQISDDAIEQVAGLPADERQAMINQMVSGLAERLEEDPSNKQNWARLIRSYIVLGRFVEAEAAMKKASELFPQDQNLKQFISKSRNQMTKANAEADQ